MQEEENDESEQEAMMKTEENMGSADSAKAAFAAFKVPAKVENVVEDMMEKAKDDPRAGVLAKLMQDEMEAVKGYRMAVSSFAGDFRTVNSIYEIIRDEEGHERLLAELWARCALKLGGKAEKEASAEAPERL